MTEEKKANEAKQKQKGFASTVKRETARLPVAEDYKDFKLHSDKDDYVEKAVYRVGEVIAQIRDKNEWNNATLLHYLDDNYFSSVQSISRLVKHDKKRLPNAGQIFELRKVFGISLDALADGEDPFALEQMPDARLIQILEVVSNELGRRIRERRKRQK